jgi:hypothetical protein
MNKEALLVVALLSTLFFAGVAGTQLIQLAKSNPIMHYPVFVRTVAPDQYTKPPTISIRSLKNNTIYGVDTFYLTFNTSIGDSKLLLLVFWKRFTMKQIGNQTKHIYTSAVTIGLVIIRSQDMLNSLEPLTLLEYLTAIAP